MNADEKIQEAFRALRRRDETAAPLFSRVIRERKRSHTGLFVALTASVTVLIVAVLHRPQPRIDETQWAKLTSWRSSTDSLLSVGTTPWGETISSPTDSLGKEIYEN